VVFDANSVTSGSLELSLTPGAIPVDKRPPAERDRPNRPELAATTVTVVTDSRLLGEGLLRLLEPYDELILNGCFSGDLRGAGAIPNPLVHVVLVDGGIGRETIVAWTQYWRHVVPPAHVIVLELPDDIDLILACIDDGAEGYALRGASIAEVATLIHDVPLHLAHCSPAVTAELFRRLSERRVARTSLEDLPIPLTAREIQVLQRIAQDYSNQQIANDLVIELSTVKHHVHSILEKLKLRHRWDAANFSRQQCCLQP
jgi:DNA-binding NarL/FixJ family response regulator